MNFIVFQVDTLRYDHLGCYGNTRVSTPSFDRLAKGSWVFERCYSGSYPSVPNRHDCFTGRHVFPFYGWQPLPEGEVVLTQCLTEAGYETHHVSDGNMLVHYGDIRGFKSWKIVPKTGTTASEEEVEKTPLPCSPEKVRNPPRLKERWAAYLHRLKEETDWGAPMVLMNAADWLRNRDRKRPFFLWMETWEVHEPWLPPKRYIDRYDPDYEGEVVADPYGVSDYLTPSEREHSQALYAATVTFVDEWFGRFMETMEDLNLLDETTIVVTSDHGFGLGDHGRFGKNAVGGKSAWSPWPLYEECAHVPLIVHMPGQASEKRTRILAQHVDILPTVLELAGVKIPERANERVNGSSWVPILGGQTGPVRKVAYTSSALRIWHMAHGGTRVTVTSPDWSLILPSPDQPAELYHLPSDSRQERNVYSSNLDVAQQLHGAFLGFLEGVGANPDKVESWRRRCQS